MTKKWANNSLMILLLIFGDFARGQGEVLLAPLPVKIKPTIPKRVDPKALRKHRQSRHKKKSAPKIKPNPTLPKKKQRIVEPPTYRTFLSLSLSWPQIYVSAPRTQFKSHLSTQFKWLQALSHTGDESLSYWLGARIAPFSGTGFINDIAGRWAYTYFGPSFGMGQLSRAPTVLKISRIKRSASAAASAPGMINESVYDQPTSGWLIDCGLALVTRHVVLDSSSEIPHKEFESTTGVAQDGASLWVEYTYLDFIDHGLSSNYSLGIQQSLGKTLVWVSIAFAGWL